MSSVDDPASSEEGRPPPPPPDPVDYDAEDARWPDAPEGEE